MKQILVTDSLFIFPEHEQQLKDGGYEVVIYVTDMSVMPEHNKVYPTYFKDPFSVREAACVQALPLGATIEMSVVSVKE